MDKIPSVETSVGYAKFLVIASKAVIKEWVKRGGDVPKKYCGQDGEQKLQQKVINSLETIFTEMR